MNELKLAVLGLFLVVGFCAKSQSQFAREDREKIVRLLHESHQKLLLETTALSELQYRFKPDTDRWNIISNVVHLINVENRIWDIVKQSLTESGDGQSSTVEDEAFYDKMVTRSTNFKAFGELLPDESKYETLEAALMDFTTVRQRTIDFVKSTDINLRAHFGKMSQTTNLDVVQWTTYAASHCYRHIEQIEEIKGKSDYPSSH